MSHYAVFDWVDFARGVAPEQVSAEMRQHLANGCDECRGEAAFYELLARVCAGMSVEAPEPAVRVARAICPQQERKRRSILLPIELVFDSFLAPAPAGLRASWQVGWQALYRAGDCSLDVRIEPDLRSSRAALIGQVSNHTAPEVQMDGIPVYLKSGKQVVAETRSNRFGEFQIEYQQQRRLQLCIDLDGGARRIVAPLRKIAADKSKSGTLNLTAVKRRKGEQKAN